MKPPLLKFGILQVNTKPLAKLLFAISSLNFILAETIDNIVYSFFISEKRRGEERENVTNARQEKPWDEKIRSNQKSIC